MKPDLRADYKIRLLLAQNPVLRGVHLSTGKETEFFVRTGKKTIPLKGRDMATISRRTGNPVTGARIVKAESAAAPVDDIPEKQ